MIKDSKELKDDESIWGRKQFLRDDETMQETNFKTRTIKKEADPNESIGKTVDEMKWENQALLDANKPNDPALPPKQPKPPVNERKIYIMRTIIFAFITIICFLTVVLLQVACFVFGVCFQSGGYIVSTSAAAIFFVKTFTTLAIQYVNYESVFYGWKKCLIPWSIFNLIYGLVLLGGGIAYLVLSSMKTSSDFTI